MVKGNYAFKRLHRKIDASGKHSLAKDVIDDVIEKSQGE
jgi:hypothetical protein